MYFVSLLIY